MLAVRQQIKMLLFFIFHVFLKTIVQINIFIEICISPYYSNNISINNSQKTSYHMRHDYQNVFHMNSPVNSFRSPKSIWA